MSRNNQIDKGEEDIRKEAIIVTSIVTNKVRFGGVK